MRIGFARFYLISCAFVQFACSERELPPPQAPSRDLPPVEARTDLPADDQTRLLLDANGEPAKVSEVTTWSSSTALISTGAHWGTAFGYSDLQRPVCLTPCFTDFAPGLHRLRFVSEDGKRSGTADVQVGSHARVLRIALGRNEPTKGSQVGALVTTVIGASMLLVGGLLVSSADNIDASNQADVQQRGFTLLGLGAGTVLVGLPWFLLSRGVHQDSAVTDFEYQPAPSVPNAPSAGPESPTE